MAHSVMITKTYRFTHATLFSTPLRTDRYDDVEARTVSRDSHDTQIDPWVYNNIFEDDRCDFIDFTTSSLNFFRDSDETAMS